LPTPSTPWTARVWAEFRAGNLTRTARDVLLTLATYRGHGGLICPSHETLAERVDCHPVTVWRALQAARDLGLVRWTERRVRAAWRSLRTSNRYRLLLPETPATPCPDRPATTLHNAGGGERKLKQEAHEQDRGALATMLAGAARLPDLLAARRQAWEGGLVRA
jgi:DNA-binding transcriptional MocR family regulator